MKLLIRLEKKGEFWGKETGNKDIYLNNNLI